MTERVGMMAGRDEDLVERAARGDVDAFDLDLEVAPRRTALRSL